MTRIEHLITLSETFASHAGITHWAVSMRIFGKGDFFRNLSEGRDCRTATAERALRWFDANWPEDLEWVDGVERPSQNKGAV